jgi:FkbM family methyltransferase
MDLRYYGQNGEDALLWQLFTGKRDGFFIEVGAFDGRYLSNSLSFEEQGWTGICVEPNAAFAAMCRKNRPRSTTVTCACVADDRRATVPFLSEPLGLLSGTRADETPNIAGRYAARGMEFPGFTAIDVPARTLDGILTDNPPPAGGIDFLSIDVEGTEIDVLRGFGSQAQAIVVEANTAAAAQTLRTYLAARGYIFARAVAQNLFFVRSKADVGVLAAAAFDIRTEPVEHPLGGKASLANMTGRAISLGRPGGIARRVNALRQRLGA